MELKRQIGLFTAALVIVADMIGTGIFTTTGQVLGITGDPLSVLVLFAVGGVIAITGSLCYSELATMWPDDGSEYVYLGKIFGPLPSFLTGWVSLIVAFSTAAAMSSIQAVKYLNELSPGGIVTGDWAPKFLAAGIIVFFALIHTLGVQKGGAVQNVFTVVKIILVVLFIGLGFWAADWSEIVRLTARPAAGSEPSFLAYGSALIVIMYAYSGWNGATYIAGEIKNPEKNLPRALFLGTVAVTVLYLAINAVFLLACPCGEIVEKGQYTIGALAAHHLFGPGVAPFFSGAIVIILLSSVSVQLMIGPRVIYAMTNNSRFARALNRLHPRLGALADSFARINGRFGTPDIAILVLAALSTFYIFIGFNNVLQILIYMGFALSIFPLLTVIGMVWMRIRHPELKRPFRVPLFPVIPLIYIALMGTVIVTTLIKSWDQSRFALIVLIVGAVAYWVINTLIRRLDAEKASRPGKK